MTKRASTAVFVAVLLALTGCGSGQPVVSAPSALSDAPPDEAFPLMNENAPPGTISKATFAGNTLKLDYYDANELGTFTR